MITGFSEAVSTGGTEIDGNDGPVESRWTEGEPIIMPEVQRIARSEPVRAVVFDAVGTLIVPDPNAVSVYHRFGAMHGSQCSLEAVAERFCRAFRETSRTADGCAESHATSELAEREFWRKVVVTVLDDLNEPAAAACFEDLFAHFARPEAWRIDPDAPPTLLDLKRRGLKLAVASNFDGRLHAIFEGRPELAPIERRFVSSELGWRKPDRRFFSSVCGGLELPPGQALYVGDEPETDIAAARAAGLQAVLIRRDGPRSPDSISRLRELPDLLAPTSVGETT